MRTIRKNLREWRLFLSEGRFHSLGCEPEGEKDRPYLPLDGPSDRPDSFRRALPWIVALSSTAMVILVLVFALLLAILRVMEPQSRAYALSLANQHWRIPARTALWLDGVATGRMIGKTEARPAGNDRFLADKIFALPLPPPPRLSAGSKGVIEKNRTKRKEVREAETRKIHENISSLLPYLADLRKRIKLRKKFALAVQKSEERILRQRTRVGAARAELEKTMQRERAASASLQLIENRILALHAPPAEPLTQEQIAAAHKLNELATSFNRGESIKSASLRRGKANAPRPGIPVAVLPQELIAEQLAARLALRRAGQALAKAKRVAQKADLALQKGEKSFRTRVERFTQASFHARWRVSELTREQKKISALLARQTHASIFERGLTSLFEFNRISAIILRSAIHPAATEHWSNITQ